VSPYIVTAKPPVQHVGPAGAVGNVWTTRAVATLDEDEMERRGVPEPVRVEIHAANLKASRGGTVGPLPDGTVIEVAPVDWGVLILAAGLNQHEAHEEPSIIAAYNEAQARPVSGKAR
jgi:hypothetical protein